MSQLHNVPPGQRRLTVTGVSRPEDMTGSTGFREVLQATNDTAPYKYSNWFMCVLCRTALLLLHFVTICAVWSLGDDSSAWLYVHMTCL